MRKDERLMNETSIVMMFGSWMLPSSEWEYILVGRQSVRWQHLLR